MKDKKLLKIIFNFDIYITSLNICSLYLRIFLIIQLILFLVHMNWMRMQYVQILHILIIMGKFTILNITI